VQSRQVNADFPGDAKQGKQLLYVPELSGSIRAYYQPVAGTTVSLGGTAIGMRYYTSINDKFLNPYITVDAAVTQTVRFESIDFSLKAEVLNAFDASYEVTAFYPMPGRAFRISLTTQIPYIQEPK
jgi:outer membrane receptor protein involved in Fe transport